MFTLLVRVPNRELADGCTHALIMWLCLGFAGNVIMTVADFCTSTITPHYRGLKHPASWMRLISMGFIHRRLFSQ